MSTLALAVIMQLAATPACTVPGMVPEFWKAVVAQESHYDPLALHDDAVGKSYYPTTIDEAEQIALQLMALGHPVGVGLSQLTAASPAQFQETFKLTIREALEKPCANMHAGAVHYVSRSLRIYNSGSPDRGAKYAAQVMALARSESGDPPPAASHPRVPQRASQHTSDTEVWD